MSILDKIYQEMYLDKTPGTENYQALQQRACELWEEAAKQLGPELADEVWTAITALNLETSSYDFKEGFRLGVQTMIEAYSQPGVPKVKR